MWPKEFSHVNSSNFKDLRMNPVLHIQLTKKNTKVIEEDTKCGQVRDTHIIIGIDRDNDRTLIIIKIIFLE